jgi:hypothetical protein
MFTERGSGCDRNGTNFKTRTLENHKGCGTPEAKLTARISLRCSSLPHPPDSLGRGPRQAWANWLTRLT